MFYTIDFYHIIHSTVLYQIIFFLTETENAINQSPICLFLCPPDGALLVNNTFYENRREDASKTVFSDVACSFSFQKKERKKIFNYYSILPHTVSRMFMIPLVNALLI